MGYKIAPIRPSLALLLLPLYMYDVKKLRRPRRKCILVEMVEVEEEVVLVLYIYDGLGEV